MSMYADILDKAFERRAGTGGPTTVSEALIALLECRSRLASTHPRVRLRGGWAASAVANQVAYDVALITLARCLGIACHPVAFDLPELRRKELDRQLAARGVHLDRMAKVLAGRRGDCRQVVSP
jgi:hypothetical protein